MINQLKSMFLLGLLTIGLVAIGAMLGPTWLIVSLLLAVALNVGGYFFSDRLVLKMHGAVEMDRRRYPRLHARTEELARNAARRTAAANGNFTLARIRRRCVRGEDLRRPSGAGRRTP